MSKAKQLLDELSPGLKRDIFNDLTSNVHSLVANLRVLDSSRAVIHHMFDELDLINSPNGKAFAKADDLLNKALVAYGKLEIMLRKARV